MLNDGRPATGVTIKVMNEPFQHDAFTGADGRFETVVTPGRVSLTARHPEFRTLRLELGNPNESGTPDAVRDLGTHVLERKPLEVVVWTVDGNGHPVPCDGLEIMESDLVTPEWNTGYPLVTGPDGRGVFYADAGLKYAVFLNGRGNVRLGDIRCSPDVEAFSGRVFEFKNPKNEIAVVIEKR